MERVVKFRKEGFRKKNTKYFNGPNTRLLHFRANPEDDRNVAKENVTLTLSLGPIGWYQFDGLNGPVRDNPKSLSGVKEYETLTGLPQLLGDGDGSRSRLSNILDTATTILTSDGFIAYSRRSSSVSAVPHRLTSAIAENINRWKDDADPRDSMSLVNKPGDERGDVEADNKYKPQKVPHPFAAVRRGVGEELSPGLLPHVGRYAIKLTGISFDLLSAHPDLLFVIAIPLGRNEILEICLHPGEDSHEGRLQFIPFIPLSRLSKADVEINEVLHDPHWTGGGHASVVRALELVDALMENNGGSFKKAFDTLAQ
jgi:hypothetical protein